MRLFAPPTQLDRYVLRQLLGALLASTGGLVALIWLTQSLRFIDLVVNRGLSFVVFLRLTGLLIPGFVAVILPITTYVVVQFVYQRLDGDRELTVMRGAGLSQWALARPALMMATLSVLICYGLNIWVVPAAAAAFREYQFQIRNRMAAFLLQEGVFTNVSDSMTIYIRARDQDGELHGIMIDDARDPASHATILAQRGHLIPSTRTPQVLLLDGSRQQIDRETGRLNVLTFAQNVIDLTQSGQSDAQRFRDATEMSIDELLHPDPKSFNPHDFGKFRVEAHKRLSGPLSAASFAMVALVAVLTGSFRRYGGLLRPVAAVLIIVALLALQLMIANLAARVQALVPLIWVQACAPGLLCAMVLFAPSWQRREASRTPPVAGVATG